MTVHEDRFSDLVRQALRELAVEKFGSVQRASIAAGRSRDTLAAQLRGDRRLAIEKVDAWLEAWSYPQGSMIERLLANDRRSTTRGSQTVGEPESLLAHLAEGSMPSSLELKLALRIEDESVPSFESEHLPSEETAALTALRASNRHRALFLASRWLADAVEAATKHRTDSRSILTLSEALLAWASGVRLVGRYKEAALALRKSLELTRQHPLCRVRAEALVKSAYLFGSMAHYEQGVGVLEEALMLYELRSDETGIASTFASRGLLLIQAGRYQEAQLSLDRVLSCSSSVPWIYRYAAEVSYGRLGLAMGRVELGMKHLREAEVHENEVNGPNLAYLLWLRADLMATNGNVSEAIEHYHRVWPLALEMFEPHEVFALFARHGRMLLQEQRYGDFGRLLEDIIGFEAYIPDGLPDLAALSEATSVVKLGVAVTQADRNILERVLAAAGRLKRPAAWF